MGNTKRTKKGKGKENLRYQPANEVEHDSYVRLADDGLCNWCGKPLTGRSKWFCPKYEEYRGPGRKQFFCEANYIKWWTDAVPKFKRVVYIRDNFTCKHCGVRPTVQNEHGVEIPDLSLLAIDHFLPYSKGGATEMGNLQVLCRKCNAKKKDKYVG